MNFIVAVDKNWGIGANGDLLFRLKNDMNYFKMLTQNKVVVMGENTLLSLPNAKPLKNRINIVLSSKSNFEVDGVKVVHNLTELFKALKYFNTDDVFVIGGAMVYKTLLPYCDYGYITKIDESRFADKYFENVDLLRDWRIISKGTTQCENNTNFSFNIYKNRHPKQFENIIEK